jgi:Peptide N-acetyl-beta-D-glucosaminyl asparaginase amidase A
MIRVKSQLLGGWFAGLLVLVGAGFATVSYGGSPIGSGNTITADPPVSRPPAKYGAPTKVTLFTNAEFNSFSPFDFPYTPPSFTPPSAPNSPRPWAKVILVCDLSVTAGVQFDRTAQMTIGDTIVFFGTTAEPQQNLGPSWHVERDLTEYSNLLMTATSGEMNIGNIVNSQYTGIIYASAYLLFYPYTQGSGEAAPAVADLIYPLPGTANGLAQLQTGTSALSTTITVPTQVQNIPTSVARAYLDVFPQGQFDDEFWYSNVPDDLAQELQEYPGTAFREVEVTIDGQVAGFAPVFPWIFTGGIDFFMWEPIPGVQTLNLAPYRVDLSPFAALLSNGSSHTISLNVYNADDYFQITANLFVYLNYNSSGVKGDVTVTGNYAPPLVITSNIHDVKGYPNGTILTKSIRHLTVEGYVTSGNTTVVSKVEQDAAFINNQVFTVTGSKFDQDITQTTTLTTKSTYQEINTKTGAVVTSLENVNNLSYPFTANINELLKPDGSGTLITHIDQNYLINQEGDWTPQIGLPAKVPAFNSRLSNVVTAQDTAFFNKLFQFTGHKDQASSQIYSFDDNQPSDRYFHEIKAANNLVTYDQEEGSTP